MKQSFSKGSSSNKGFKINNQIKAKEVRVINENGDMIGVLDLGNAIKQASDSGLDLVEVSPNVNPPVCKITNFGKMKYEMQKKAADAKKKQKIVETKEIKMSINIGKGDYNVKIKQVMKFIEKGDKVKVSIRMKGREMSHLDLAHKMMADVSDDISQVAKFEFVPKMEGRQMVAVLIKK